MSRRNKLTYGSLSPHGSNNGRISHKYSQKPLKAPEYLDSHIHAHEFKGILLIRGANVLRVLRFSYHFPKRLRNAPRTGLEPSRRIGIPLNPLTGFYGPIWGHESGIDELPKPLTNLLP